MPSRSNALGKTIAPLAIAFLAIILWTSFGSLMVMASRNSDFLNLYTGAILARSGQFSHLYDYSAQNAAAHALAPNVQLTFPFFVRPPFYALALLPLALVPFAQAFWVWIGIQIALLLACWYWAWREFGPDSLVWTSLFLPTALGIASGEDCVLFLVLGCGAWEAYRRRSEATAGLLLSLMLFKFHLVLLIPVALLARRRWRVLGGYITGALALIGLSLWLGGWNGARAYAALLTRTDLPKLSTSPEEMLGINSLLANFGIHSIPLTLVLAAGIALLVVRCAIFSSGEWHWFWAAVTGSLLISPHTYQYDAAILLIPGLLAVFHGETRTLRILGATVLIPLLYGMNLAGSPYSAIPSTALILFLLALTGVLSLRLRTADRSSSTQEEQLYKFEDAS